MDRTRYRFGAIHPKEEEKKLNCYKLPTSLPKNIALPLKPDKKYLTASFGKESVSVHWTLPLKKSEKKCPFFKN